MVRTLLIFLSIGFLALSFNNCGRIIPGVGVDSGVISLQASLGQALCESRLKQTYAGTYHTFFRSNCTSCHQHTSSHASSDLNVSFSAFRDKGQTTLETRMNSPHGGGYTPPAGAPAQIASIRNTWLQAERTYETCVEESGGHVFNAGSIDLIDKTVPNLNNTRGGNGSNNASFVPLSWNVSTETLRNADQGKLSATLRVDVGLLISQTPRSGAPIEGLIFRNPTLTLNGVSEYVSIGELAISIDGQEMAQITTYKNGVLLTVSGSAPVNMAPGLGVAHAYKTGVTSGSRVSLSIRGLVFSTTAPPTPTPPPNPTPPATPTPPDPTSYNELMGNDAAKNVFRRTCAGCHSPEGTDPMAAQAVMVLDITTFATARDKAQQIQNRVNMGTMPPGQPLNNADRAKVNAWITGGTLEVLPPPTPTP